MYSGALKGLKNYLVFVKFVNFMSSFFEKLKKGMGAEIEPEPEEETLPKEVSEKSTEESKKPEATPRKKVTNKIKIKAKNLESEKETTTEPPAFVKVPEENGETLFEAEGELAVDVYQTDGEVVIMTAIAGVKPSDLDINIESDIVLIRGRRTKPNEKEEINYVKQECFWGPFSEKIILPEETDAARAEATMKEGVLMIRIPKIERLKKRKLIIK